ncbi:RodZ domain-containing protein [Thiorhodococcus minor]|uniref:Helix-turn-helix domain-containing protein n=1 Tax=Thiorhodococcus minor TaxID=57489 RepID=A0A6M0JW28_9GAMM|nr:RodZ family helix-turn-helix domain-containing protein [Thiorhodococcus minor]NEV61718.1 helix-turn-helix domain-containing protein [Thiorhodococcus minor]
MNQPVSTQPDDQIEQYGSPGRQLRALREGRNMGTERVAAQLHLDRRVIEALERDQFEELPSPVFISGYLRNYARLLGADPKPIIRAYNAVRPDADTHVRSTAGTHLQSRGSGRVWGWVIGLTFVLVAGGLAGLWWQGRDAGDDEMTALSPVPATVETQTQGILADEAGPETTSADEETATPVDSFGAPVSVPSDAIPLRPSGTAQGAPSAPPSGEEAAAAASETIPATSLPSEPAPELVVEAAPNRDVVLEFSATSWVDVRDAAGEVVLNGEMRDGDRRVLSGEPPYKLVIGNAAATQLSIGGKPFDLESRARGNVARFSLDPDTTQ